MHLAPDRLSHELRRGTGRALRQRRAVAGLSLLAAGAMGVVALYQLGILKHVPEPPLPGFDADKVTGSAEAYGHLATPDAVLGLGSFAATLTLAAIGGEDRAKRHPWLPIALAGKTLVDAILAARQTRDEVVKQKAYCLWCLVAAAATFTAVPFAFSAVFAGRAQR